MERVSTPQLLYELDPEPRDTVPEPEPEPEPPQTQTPQIPLTFQFHPGVSVVSPLRRNRDRTTRPRSYRRTLIDQERQNQQRIMTVEEERAFLQTVYQLLQQFTEINTVQEQSQYPNPDQTEEDSSSQEINPEF